jgi:plastocyanin
MSEQALKKSDASEEIVRIIAGISVTAVAAFLAMGNTQRTFAAEGKGEIVTVRLSNFAFDPNHLQLKVGVPIRLRLVNESNGGHDFSAPAFFAATKVLPDASAPSSGEMAVGSHQTVEIEMVPRTPGTYRVECTHFLHSFFGMHGTIEVTP